MPLLPPVDKGLAAAAKRTSPSRWPLNAPLGPLFEREREERVPRGGGGSDLCTKPSWTAVQVRALLLLEFRVCADRVKGLWGASLFQGEGCALGPSCRA